LFWLTRQPETRTLAISAPLVRETITSSPTSASSLIKVYVSGAVTNPGVFEMALGQRVEDAITKAGGAKTDANLTTLNLAAKVRDEQHIHVPLVGEKSAVFTPVVSGRTSPDRLNLNTANLSELETLPGIGKARALSIIEYRRSKGGFTKIEELLTAKLVPQNVFDDVKEKITVE
jgi:competence protein ComEA